MTVGTEVIRGALKLDGFQEGKCFTSWQDFVQAMPSLFTIEVPSDITNVTLSQTEPSDSERDHLWIKLDAAGSFLGLYIFAQGAWRKIYPLDNEIFFMFGDSRNIPAGYTLASDYSGLSPAQLVNMQKIWTEGGSSPTWYSSFHVVYTGF